MQELNVLIADTNYQRSKIMKERVKNLAAYRDIQNLRLYFFEETGSEKKTPPTVWECLHIAFIEMNYPNAAWIGQTIYRHNPACRLVYCRENKSDLSPWLPSRPVACWDSNDLGCFDRSFQDQIDAIFEDSLFFSYSDRLRALSVPYSSIGYFFSQNRAVYIQTEGETIGPIPKSLDEIEKLLHKGDFLRVHKSFLVRRRSVRQLDRKNREMILRGGVRVPISRSMYERTLGYFCKNGSDTYQNNEIADK